MSVLTLNNLQRHLHSLFRIDIESGISIELELVMAEDSGSTADHEQFSILFRGPHDPLLPQRIYQLHHESLGLVDLFLVPVERAKAGILYEAAFSRRNATGA